MSKISLSPNASGTGNFTIASPATNTDRTLTLPDNTGTILTSASNTNFPAGSVLQVTTGTYNTQGSITTATWTDTGLTASITPSSSSNKILAIVNMTGLFKAAGTNTYMGLKLLRGSTDLIIFDGQALFTNSTAATEMATGASYLDSPATSSSVTYKVQVSNVPATGTVYWSGSNSVCTLTLMEIKG